MLLLDLLINSSESLRGRNFKMESFKIVIPEGHTVSTKVIGNELVVWFTKKPVEPVEPKTDNQVTKLYSLYTDGGSRGNGRKNSVAGIGGIIYSEGRETETFSKKMASGTTNNEAEYQALLVGLELAKYKGFKNIKAHVDSKLVCNQVNGVFKVNKPELKVIKDKILKVTESFDFFELVHVLRHLNSRADALANQAMDRLT